MILKQGSPPSGEYAFSSFTSLTSITISDSVISIGMDAFWGCSGMTSITIPDSVTSIGETAFSGCSSLTSITIPDNVTSIGDFAFTGCSNLVSIIIPDSVTSIGDGTFTDCRSMTSVSFGDGVTSIGDFVFEGCTRLISVTIGKNVNSIGDWAFSDGVNPEGISLKEIIVTSANPQYSSHDGVLFNKSGSELIRCPEGKTGVYTIPDTTTSIGFQAFRMSSLTSITIPDSVTIIGDESFVSCSSLTHITIPDSVTSIGDGAFVGCSLTSITIPDSIVSIGNYAFDDCSNLTDVHYSGTKAQWEMISIDEECNSPLLNATIHFEPDIVASGECGDQGDNVTWTLDSEGTLTISGTGRMRDYYELYQVPWEYESEGDYNPKRIKIVVLKNGVTSIGDYAFYGCSSLKSITIPDSVTEIGSDVFSGCSSLMSITIPDGVTSIGNSVFSNCNSLTSIIIPRSVTSIGVKAFYECTSLTDVYYDGKEADWNRVSIGSNNTCLLSARKHFTQADHTHSFGTGTITTPPTCTEPGVRTFTCSCGETKTEPEPALGHNFVNGICTRCHEPDPDYIPLSVVTLPAEVSALDGEEAVVTVQAAGNGLTYVWYVKAPSEAEFTLTDTTTAEYRITMSKALDGTQAYCVVTDAYRNTVQTGIVTLRLKPDHTPGDINGDGRVNNRDLTRLAQYLAGKDVEYVKEALDVNGDGKANNKDLTRLAQYLAGRDVELH